MIKTKLRRTDRDHPGTNSATSTFRGAGSVPVSGGHASSLRLDVRDGLIVSGYLCVYYTVELPWTTGKRPNDPASESEGNGIAIAHGGRVYDECRCSYRAKRHGHLLDGVLCIGPDVDPERESLRVFFAPIPADRGYGTGTVCELGLHIEGTLVDVVSMRTL